MKKHPKTFDPLFTNMIAAGEAGGILDTILKRLAIYIEKNVKLKGQVKSAMIYPVAVIVIAGAVVGVILWKVIPTFAALFAGLGARPAAADARRHLAERRARHATVPVHRRGSSVVGGYALQAVLRDRAAAGASSTALMLKLPILGLILRKIAVARFCRTLSTLHQLRRADSGRPRDHREDGRATRSSRTPSW